MMFKPADRLAEPIRIALLLLDLHFQHESLGADREANWLPAPAGAFNLTMRLYAPQGDALTGKWNPPPVTKNQGPSALQIQ